jgi:Tfp pilus assembly protein PilP
MNEDINKFCRKYEAIAKPDTTNRYACRMPPLTLGNANSAVMYESLDIKRVPMVNICIPEDRFRALVEYDKWLETEKHRSGVYIGDRAANIVKNHEEEIILRHQHPGLMALWEQYQTMLHLVR